MFSTEVSYAIEAAYREASVRKHAFFAVEHLFFALLFDERIQEIIESCGGDTEGIKADLEIYFKEEMEVSVSDEKEPIQTPALQRVLQRAMVHMRSAGKPSIQPEDVLIAIMGEEESHAVHFLTRYEISKLDLIQYISHGVVKERFGLEEEDDAFLTEEDESPRKEKRGSALKKYAEDLTAQAERGELDPVIGREGELSRTIRILCRRQKNNPLFLGDPGIGKTAMANGLALKIFSGEVPETLRHARLFSLNVGSLLAGTKFRGEFEERLRLVVKELTETPSSILFIDEIHTIVGAGATGTSSLDAANLLKPALASGKIRIIGSTTHEDYKKSFEKDRALSRRFSQIDLLEPSVDETISILKGLKERFEQHHKVVFSYSALKAAAELSAKHINERFLPDKAIDVMDEAGAANTLLSKSKRKATLTERDIERVVSLIAKVPVKSVSSSDERVLEGLEDSIERKVFGQKKAVQAVVRAIKRSRANLTSADKPVGSFLFAGPTGVGKTELARTLARELGIHFHRFDMSEYMEKHTVARLIGAPPGYVGYEEGGLLTDLIRKHPYAVLLFDEIEKAHQDIYNIMLQILDDATLTDSHGKKADFRHVIIIMTTNAGSDASGAIGFGMLASGGNQDTAIKKLFRPEFRNRLDEVVYFDSLPSEAIGHIVDKFMSELETQLSERKVTFVLSGSAREHLAKKGFDPALGARPMARTIQKEIKDPLTDEILFGRLKRGGKVVIDEKEGELVFDFEERQSV